MRFVSKADFESAVLYKLFIEANQQGNWKASYEITKLFEVQVPSFRVQLALDALLDDGRVDARTPANMPNGVTLYRINNWGLSMIEGRMKQKGSFLLGFAEDGDSLVDVGEIGVPASDRIVSLNHNQVSHADAQLTQLVETVERDNGDPGQPRLRERIVGQLRAGRELIRSGEYKAYLLHVTLVRALNEIIQRYKNPAIVALANALLGAVVSDLLQAS